MIWNIYFVWIEILVFFIWIKDDYIEIYERNVCWYVCLEISNYIFWNVVDSVKNDVCMWFVVWI